MEAKKQCTCYHCTSAREGIKRDEKMVRGAGGFRDYSSEAMILNIPVKNLNYF